MQEEKARQQLNKKNEEQQQAQKSAASPGLQKPVQATAAKAEQAVPSKPLTAHEKAVQVCNGVLCVPKNTV